MDKLDLAEDRGIALIHRALDIVDKHLKDPGLARNLKDTILFSNALRVLEKCFPEWSSREDTKKRIEGIELLPGDDDDSLLKN